MNVKISVIGLLFLLSGQLWAQEIYGVFGLPNPNIGHRQIGTINQSDGNISLLGNSTSVETGTLAMTTGATALNVNDNRSYFVARNSSNEDRIYTVDLSSGITLTNPLLTAGYTTSNNWGVWYDEPDGILYGLFDRGVDIELAIINPTTGVVTPHDAAIAPSGSALASGLLTGDSANNRVFVMIEDSLYVIDTDNADTHYALLLEDFWGAFTPSVIYGLEWDKSTDVLWVLYTPGSGARSLIGFTEIEEGGEPGQAANIEIDFGDPVTTASGLSALDSQSSLFFFIGRPNGGTWSLYDVDLNTEQANNVNIENPVLVQTNGYQGIEVLPGPMLSMTKDDGDVSAIPGGTITYTLDFNNAPGTGATSGLEITETVPVNTSFLPGSSTPGWACLPNNNAGSTCTINPNDLSPGGNGQVTFAVQVVDYVSAGTTQVSNSASITANNTADVIMASDDTPITAAATLSLTKSDGDITAIPGDSITYQVTLSNTGNELTDQAVITETVPTLTSFNVGASDPGWNCNDIIAGSICTYDAGTVGGTAVVIDFVVDVITSVPAGTTEVSNGASALASNASQVNANDTTPITSSAVLTLSKSDGGLSVEPGQSIIYIIDYANMGNQDADTVVINESILAQTSFDPSNSSPGWNCILDSCTYDIPTLGGGENSSVAFALQLTDPVDEFITELDNTVSITATNATTVVANDITPVIADADLRLVKTDGGITAGLDKIINYTLIYFNDGNRNAIDVTLEETVPDFTTFQPASSTPGWACTPNNFAGSQCILTLGSLDGHDKGNAFFAVKTDSNINGPLTELSNTAHLSASNAPNPDDDTVLTPIDIIRPLVTSVQDEVSNQAISACEQINIPVNQLRLSLLDDQGNFQGLDEFENYMLIDAGLDEDIQTLQCGSPLGDDSEISISMITADNFINNPEVILDLAEELNSGVYGLFLCDGITDAAGNTLELSNQFFISNNLIHPFRVDQTNLFENAYLDSCDPLDFVPSPWEWQVEGDMQVMVSEVTEPDVNGAEISGSIEIVSPNGSNVGVSQCQSVMSNWPYRIGVNVLGDLMQIMTGEIILSCASSSQIDCSDVLSSDSTTLTQTIAPGQWLQYQGILWTDPAALAARCSVISKNTSEAVMLHLDELIWQDADLIFTDGFETE